MGNIALMLSKNWIEIICALWGKGCDSKYCFKRAYYEKIGEDEKIRDMNSGYQNQYDRIINKHCKNEIFKKDLLIDNLIFCTLKDRTTQREIITHPPG